MKNSSFDLAGILEAEGQISTKKMMRYVFSLSLPGMLAQVSSILMQYIDSSMVGALGAGSSASIGLVLPGTWVLGSLLRSCGIGFTVQTAHCIGAGEKFKAKRILFNGLFTCVFFSLILALIASSISFFLPSWLGSPKDLQNEASWYFLIFSASSPFFALIDFFTGMNQCSGNMKIPGILNGAMCFLDILFNWFFIYRCNLGVKGAALGSVCAVFLTSAVMAVYTFFFSNVFKFEKNIRLDIKKNWKPDFPCIKSAMVTSFPVAVESTAFSGALVAVTKIIAPLGAVSLAANSFATTAESLCYMPVYGIQEAAAALTGQSYGAKRNNLVKGFSAITVMYGAFFMAFTGIVMYFLCPVVFRFITPDIQIQQLAVEILRIELFAEPFFGCSIVAAGALRGKGDTLVPGIMNLFSLWVVRIGLSLLLVEKYALKGIWIAMAVELTFRGIILVLRLAVSSGKN